MKTGHNRLTRRFGACELGQQTLKLFIAAVVVALSQIASAGTSQDQEFFNTLRTRCSDPSIPFGSDLYNLCASAFSGGLAGGTYSSGLVSTNIGTSGIQGTASQSSAAQQRMCTDSPTECREAEKKKAGGASADFSFAGIGFLVSAQGGATARNPTDLENGFDSDAWGLTFGADYLVTDRFLVGLTLGYNDNDATFRDSAGGLRSKTTSGTLYLAYTPLDNAYLGGYLGTGRIRNSGNKRVLFGGVSGTTGSSNGGNQDIAGASGGYDWQLGSARLGGFLNVDSAWSRLDGYTESGNTGLELIQPAQKIRFLTSTLGLRLSASRAYDWGTLQPEVRLAHVHEFQNDARVITTALAIDPITRFFVATDSPDRNWGLIGLGSSFETGRGTRWFVDYERRVGHAFLSSWAASGGVIIGF